MHTTLLQSSKARAAAAALIAAIVIVFAVYVWPTPYRYFTLHEPAVRPARVQRFTGATELLGVNGWVNVAEARARRAAAAADTLRRFDSLTARR